MEHRWGTRVAIDLPVRISTEGLTGTGVLRNVSASGAFIETALPLAVLTMVRIHIPRDEACGTSHKDAWCFVVRQEARGVGVEWCEAAPLRVEDLTQPAQILPLSPSRLLASRKVAQR
jgi:hypothetical protein